MRIEDQEIIRILERDGPAVASYIAQILNVTEKHDRQKLNHHLKMLSVYKFLNRVARDGNYIYYIPGDKRPVNYPSNHRTPRHEKIKQLVENMAPNEELDSKKIQSITGYSRSWATELMNRTNLKQIPPDRKNRRLKWKKEAVE